MKLQTYIPLFLLLILFGCSQRIDFENEFMTNQLVVNSIVSADSLIRVDVYQNTSINEALYQPLTDAEVSIWQDGEKLENLKLDYTLAPVWYEPGRHDEFDTTFFYTTTFTEATPGNTYKLKIEHKDFETAYCETSVVHPVQITSLDTTSIYESGSNEESFRFNFSIQFSDPADKKNYYRIVSYLQRGKRHTEEKNGDTISYIQNYKPEIVRIQSQDPVFTNENEDADNELFGAKLNSYDAFSDELFQGGNYSLNISKTLAIKWWGDSGNIKPIYKIETGEYYRFIIELQSISPETYYYYKSVDSQQSVDNLPFIEPVPVFNNVENGMGIFGSYSSSNYEITFGDYPIEGMEYRNVK